MKLLQTLVSRAGFRDPAANGIRTELFRRLLSVAGELPSDVLLLPGGYWTVIAARDVEPLADALSAVARDAGLTLVAGIDVESPPSKGKGVKGGTRPHLPFYCFAGGSSGPTRVWRQTSSDRYNALEVADADVPGADRVVAVGPVSVGVLICGELFSARARATMSARAPTLVVDLGHLSMGTGVTRSMERIAADGGCAVAHSQHVAPGGGASLHFVTADARRQSVPVSDCDWIGDDAFWIAYRVRDFP